MDKVIRAKTAGFCMGVALALRKLDKELAEKASGETIYTLGPLIHNPYVLNSYAQKGVKQLSDLSAVGPGDRVVIRAHGVPKDQEERLQLRGASIVDATCPKVKKAQMMIAAATENGSRLLLFGEPEHPEVQGLLSYAQGEPSMLLTSKEDVNELLLDPNRAYVLAAQTTQHRKDFEEISLVLKRSLSKLEILDTICDATRQRQTEVIAIAKQVDLVVVVGGYSSGNTRRLVQVVRDQGIQAVHIEEAGELDSRLLNGVSRVGLTAGASTPKYLIDAVEDMIRSLLGS